MGDEYLDWLGGLGEQLGDLLTEDGSLVVELGNAWEQGEPVMSTLALEALMRVLKDGEFRLCQQFVVHNPARLPSPAQWVNIERCRVKDAYTNVWWMSRSARPKADNRKVLVDYSPSMRKLLERQSYNPGGRPSEHHIGETSFLSDNGGAIPSNVLTIANTVSTDDYRRYVKAQNLKVHPARMPPDLAEFFIRFLTDQDDLVFDPFGGSNTTGATAEALGRQWITTEPDPEYIAGSRGPIPGHHADRRIRTTGRHRRGAALPSGSRLTSHPRGDRGRPEGQGHVRAMASRPQRAHQRGPRPRRGAD